MELIGFIVFLFTIWCVFSRHFADGIIGKLLLSLSSVSGFITAMDGNIRAACGAGILLVLGILYAYLRPTRRRPLFIDRRERPRHS